MKTTTIRLSQITVIPDIEPPVIRTAKEWRRYQVMLRRLNVAIESNMLSAVYGDRFDFNPPPRERNVRRGAYIFDATA